MQPGIRGRTGARACSLKAGRRVRTRAIASAGSCHSDDNARIIGSVRRRWLSTSEDRGCDPTTAARSFRRSPRASITRVIKGTSRGSPARPCPASCDPGRSGAGPQHGGGPPVGFSGVDGELVQVPDQVVALLHSGAEVRRQIFEANAAPDGEFRAFGDGDTAQHPPDGATSRAGRVRVPPERVEQRLSIQVAPAPGAVFSGDDGGDVRRIRLRRVAAAGLGEAPEGFGTPEHGSRVCRMSSEPAVGHGSRSRVWCCRFGMAMARWISCRRASSFHV